MCDISHFIQDTLKFAPVYIDIYHRPRCIYQYFTFQQANIDKNYFSQHQFGTMFNLP
jgi:hypothetical protein